MTISTSQTTAHYPYAIRMLIDLYDSGQLPALAAIDIEPQYGHAARLSYADGSVHLVRGHGLGINNHGASLIAKDKAYSKFFLQRLGYQTPPGKAFIMPDYLAAIERKLSRFGLDHYAKIDEIYRYTTDAIGYPCYVKPNDGSQGRGIYRCENADELRAALESYDGQPLKLVLVEAEITFSDYRVVVLGDQVVACYQRLPLNVVGDGVATIAGLLTDKERAWEEQGRKVRLETDDPRIVRKLARYGFSLATVLERGRAIQVADIANLSAGGSAEDFSARIHPHWAALCVEITRAMGLHFCGVDLACGDITDAAAPYSILEINGSPGMDNFATLGAEQAAAVRTIYRTIFNEMLPRRG